MKILLICGNGVSSGMIAQKIRKAGIARGYDAVSDAYSYSQLSEVVDEFDVVLVAPQMKFNEDMRRDLSRIISAKYNRFMEHITNKAFSVSFPFLHR